MCRCSSGPDPSLLDEEHKTTPLVWAEVAAEVADYLRTLG